MDLSKSLNLFRNNGATPFQYTIAYSESYTRNGVDQTVYRPSNGGWFILDASSNDVSLS